VATSVSEQTLLEGSWYALEQAGRLLHSSKILFESGDFSTALAVAMFGREELGRSLLLRDCAKEVSEGGTLRTEQITKRCENHVKKQAASAFGITLRPSSDSELGRALNAKFKHAPGSDEWARAESFINSASEAKQKRQPDERHQLRCSSLYVDISAMGTDWARPVEISKEDALNNIYDAINDYSQEIDRLTTIELRSILEQHSPRVRAEAMSIAREKMVSMNILPPAWPSYEIE
jgi:AbiV family abortive infection protein